MKGFLSELMDIVKEHLNDEDDEAVEEEGEGIPHMHLTLNIPGFTALSSEATTELIAKIPKIDPDLPSDNQSAEVQVYQSKRFNRDRNLGPYSDLYRRVSAVDPESAPNFKHGGVLVADAAKLADQQHEQIVDCLAEHLPAYIFKEDYDDHTFGFEVSSPEALLALLNNHVYYTYNDFGYRDPVSNAEQSFNNLLLGYSSHINVMFPSLESFLHLGHCGQLYIGAKDIECLEGMEKLLQPAGDFVAMDY